MYVANRPSALISRDRGATWQQLPWQFQTPGEATITPFWNITEDKENDFILFSEYGHAVNGPHHRIIKSNANRTLWTYEDIEWGQYRHIHGYHINPYNSLIHLLFLGDVLKSKTSSGQYINQADDKSWGFYISQDGGKSWSDEILSQNNNALNFNKTERLNGPTMTTWWPSPPNGKALISNDTGGPPAAWYGNGPNNWGYLGLHPKINLMSDIDDFSTWPATPWGASALKDGYETYCISNHDGAAWNGDPHNYGMSLPYTPPSVLWRFDPVVDPTNHDNDGNKGKITVMAKIYYPAAPFLYLSAGIGNVFPDGDYIFCNAWGGVRIPRKVITHKTSLHNADTTKDNHSSNG
jgi:hypothetical protein